MDDMVNAFAGLGYDLVGLDNMIYAVDPGTAPPGSCSGGCKTTCQTCFAGCANGPTG